MGEYHDAIDGTMVRLGVPLGHPTSPDLASHGQAFADTAADFQFLRLRFQQAGERVHALAGAISALAGLAGNRAVPRALQCLPRPRGPEPVPSANQLFPPHPNPRRALRPFFHAPQHVLKNHIANRAEDRVLGVGGQGRAVEHVDAGESLGAVMEGIRGA